MSQTAQIHSGGGAGAPIATPSDTLEWKKDGIEIRPADGLRGAVGLYEVTANGHTRYLPREEAEDLKRALSDTPDASTPGAGGQRTGATTPHGATLFSSPDANCGPGGCFTDDDIYGPAGASSWAARASAPRPMREVEGTPGPKHDVTRMTQSEIDALKKSRDPAQARLGRTIENAKVAYADLIAAGGKVTVTTSAGNGGQPVVVITGRKFDPTQPARVHTHYHGDNATAADPRGSKAGTNARIQEVIARSPQTVFVVPESLPRAGQDRKQVPDGPKHDGFYNANWTNAKSQAQTTDDALATIGVTRVGKEVVSFHSRGGEALQQIMKDKTGNGLRADRVELHDCLYGSQYQAAAWARTDNGKAVGRVIFYHGSNRADAHEPVQGAFGSKFTKVEMGRQKALDDSTNPVHRDPDGKTYTRVRDWEDKNGVKHVNRPTVRQFDPDPHYRTTGQFLDAYD